MKQPTILLPEHVAEIIHKIEQAGYEAYAVGGCIRDCILGREPNDWDITTSARPEQVKALFRRTIDTGIQHGTVTVMLDRQGYEVTTYRIDGEYEDSRHPKEVTFTADLYEDLRRRDFTINALAYNDRSGLIDAFDGIGDMEKGLIRCVGDPSERFTEDALRMMRAVRFSAQLGYAIEEETKEAIRKLVSNLKKVSVERIQAELTKLITSDHPDELRVAYEMGITEQVLPEFDLCMKTGQNNPHHMYSVGEHILRAMTAIEPDKVLRLTMLLHDIAKPQTLTIDEEGITHNHGHAAAGEKITAAILRRLRYDNETISKVSRLVCFHDYRVEPNARAVRKAVNKVGVDLFPLLLKVQAADLMAQSTYQIEEKKNRLNTVKQLYEQALENQEAMTLKDLAITGSDLIACGMKPGRQIGETLQKLMEYVLEDPARNTKEELLRIYKML